MTPSSLLYQFLKRSLSYFWSTPSIYFGLEPAPPVLLNIGITNECNLKCDFCFHGDNTLPGGEMIKKGYMSYDLFSMILEQASGWVSNMDFDLFGEPTLHPRFFDMVSLAVKKGFSVQIWTNGTLLTEKNAKRLIDIGPASIVFSLEGGSSAENERLRVGSSSGKAEENLAHCISFRKKSKKKSPMILVSGLALDMFAGQKAAHNKRFIDLGVDHTLWLPPTNWTGSLSSPQGSVDNPLPLPKTELCKYPWTVLAVDWDGYVVPCCEDFRSKNSLGNAGSESLKSIWRGEKIKDLRKTLRTRNRDLIAERTGCSQCSKLSHFSVDPSKGATRDKIKFAVGESWRRFVDSYHL